MYIVLFKKFNIDNKICPFKILAKVSGETFDPTFVYSPMNLPRSLFLANVTKVQEQKHNVLPLAVKHILVRVISGIS